VRRQYPFTDRFELAGVRFLMTHIAGRPGRWESGLGPELKQDPPDVLVCGHSHILRIERVADLAGMLYLNPGAAGRQGFHREKTCVILHIDGGRAVKADVVHLDA
jgi:predicted phosphodiesterase